MSLSTMPRVSLQDAIDALTEALSAMGLRLLVQRDFMELGELLQGYGSFVNPSFDPQQSILGEGDFWLAAVDEAGEIVATSAERVVETDDFMELIATGRLWYEGGFAKRFGIERVPTLELRQGAGGTPLCGRLSHSGSTFVRPSHRRSGLAMILPYLSRALSFKNSGCVANTGLVRQGLAASPVPVRSYGYAHVEKCLDGWFPPQGGSEILYLCWIDRPEFEAKLAELPSHPTHPIAIDATMRRPRLELVR